MDWFNYIRENIWVGIIFASIFSSVANVIINLSEKAKDVPDTKISVSFAILFGVAITKLDLDWRLFSSYQDTFIRLSATILVPYLVARFKGVEIANNLIDNVVQGAKNFTIGKKDQ